MTDTTTRNKRT